MHKIYFFVFKIRTTKPTSYSGQIFIYHKVLAKYNKEKILKDRRPIMKTSIPCPNCQEAITLDDFEDFSSPFTMKCPYCQAKLKETKVTPFLLMGLLVMIPLFIFLTEIVISMLSGVIPAIEKVPFIIVFIGLLYPLYALYERMNGLIMFNKGNLQLKTRQK